MLAGYDWLLNVTLASSCVELHVACCLAAGSVPVPKLLNALREMTSYFDLLKIQVGPGQAWMHA